MTGEHVELLRAARRGAVSSAEVLAESDRLDQELAAAIAASTLPDGADRERINAVLHGIHLARWAER